LYFYRIFALSVQGREKDFMDQMPESVQARERYYRDLVDLLGPLRKAYETVASVPRASGAKKRFRDEYSLYRAEREEKTMMDIWRHVHGSRLIGPQAGEVTS
jgi:plasmid stabilization system protein ParE